MAAALSLSFVEGILSKLGSSTVPFLGFVFCYKDEKRKLTKTLSAVKSLVLDAEKLQEMGHSNEDWVGKLRIILYEADDLAEEVSDEAEKQRELDLERNMGDKILCFFKTTLPFFIKMAWELKGIRERLDDVAADRKNFPPIVQQDGGNQTGNEETRMEPQPYIRPADIIGREEEKKDIKNMIKDAEVEVSNVPTVIAIIGMGGLGKTTLARLVHEDAEAFDLKMWVWVSQDFDVKRLLIEVIKSATRNECGNLGMDGLQSKLRTLLDGKKFLLVLDDIWIHDLVSWNQFGNLLKGGAKGSVILATTRETKVASTIGAGPKYQYPLKDLEKDDCLSLLEQGLGFKLNQMGEEHMRVGKELLNKCGRLPLAILAVAGLLRDPDSDWQNINNDELWSQAQEDNGILPSLRVSYARLPSSLKKCFAFCSLFPKGYEIEKVMLTQMWLAQGFTEQPSNKRPWADSGDKCFKELRNRSFLQDIKEDKFGNVISCKMHDLMHDLAKDVAGSEYVIVNDEAVGNSDKMIHASILGWNVDRLINDGIFPTNARNLRTFMMSVWLYYSKENAYKHASSFKRLRVLHVFAQDSLAHNVFAEDSLEHKVPNSIGELKHLRYLNLSRGNFRMLPDSICELRHLQTLKLNNCSYIEELPGEIKKLTSLVHLENEGCDMLKGMPVGIGQLTLLQTLPLYVLGGEGSGGLSELENLNNLRGGLCIKNLHNARNATSESRNAFYLKKKIHLQTLLLKWEIDENDLEKMLSKFEISSDGFRPKELPMREGYRDEDVALLESLEPNAYLKELSIRGYSGVEFPSWTGKSLPNLVRIHISKCPNCECLPLFVDQLAHLKVLSLRKLPELKYIHSYMSESSISSSFNFNSLSRVVAWFPALKEVYLKNLPKLKEWDRKVIAGGKSKSQSVAVAVAAEPKQLLSLETLSTLVIEECLELKSIPLIPNVKQLDLWFFSGALIESMTMAETIPSTSLLPSLLTHSKLKSTNIEICRDLVSLPQGWLENLTSLEELTIVNCDELVSLSPETPHMLKDLKAIESITMAEATPTTSSLPSLLTHSKLKSIRIAECKNLVSLPQGWLENLTSLEELHIFDCAELMSLSPETPHVLKDLKDSSEDDDLQSFTRLRELSLGYIPTLTSLPNGLQYATNLKKLVICSCDGLVRWLDSMGNITSLHRLEIKSLQTLTSLPQALRHLTALQTLELEYCPELNFSDDDNDTPIPTNLHSLILWSLPKLTFLPDWLKVLTSLQHLRIHDCKELKSLPQTMSRLTALQRLYIHGCPQLSETHQRDSILPNIAHIPEIRINNEYWQRRVGK